MGADTIVHQVPHVNQLQARGLSVVVGVRPRTSKGYRLHGLELAAYKVTKHAVVILSETLYHELKFQGAKLGVSVLCPAWVNTRIMESERNRPVDLQTPCAADLTPEQEMMDQIVHQLVAGGLPPSEVAEQVLSAIRDERFYVLTNPDSRAWVRARAEDVITERNPTIGLQIG